MIGDGHITTNNLVQLLKAVESHLPHGFRVCITVIGGGAMLARGVAHRLTRDLDSIDELPDELTRAADAVAAEFGLEAGWLNDSRV